MAKKTAICGKPLLTSFILFILFLSVLVSVNELKFDGLLRFHDRAFRGTDDSRDASLPPTSSYHIDSEPMSNISTSSGTTEDLRILIGILTLPDQSLRRSNVRLIYGTQPKQHGARVDIRFVFCNLTKEEHKVWVALEIMLYNDIIILNCTENMDEGKTYTYFSSLPELFNGSSSDDPPYHYVMKADDDTYFRLEKLVDSLRPLPRDDLYYGFIAPCPSMDTFGDNYMAGMGYLVSWDIAEWIRESDIPRNHQSGPEDKVFGQWLKMGRRANHRFNTKWAMYDYPEPETACTHKLWSETIGVHKLKTEQKWIQTLKYFNATSNLKPSKLYHI